MESLIMHNLIEKEFDENYLDSISKETAEAIYWNLYPHEISVSELKEINLDVYKTIVFLRRKFSLSE
jgi:hypothetical protein